MITWVCPLWMLWYSVNPKSCTHLLRSTLRRRHDERGGDLNHRRLDCLLNHLFRRRWKKTSKLRVTGLWEENPLVTGEFPSQRASNVEKVSIWLRHHASPSQYKYCLSMYSDSHHKHGTAVRPPHLRKHLYIVALCFIIPSCLTGRWEKGYGGKLISASPTHHFSNCVFFAHSP